jgi:polysaccharide biosynthesis/export protein
LRYNREGSRVTGEKSSVRSYQSGLLALSLLVAGSVLAGCGSPGANLPPVAAADSSSYRLGAGDQVRIITFSDEQLTGEFRVNDGGTVALPLLGAVHAAGLTTAQLETEVANALRQRNLYKDPSVAVEVIAYRPVFILGEVTRPGQYPYQPGMTVVTTVAVAGGYTYRAVEDHSSIVRTMNGKAVEGLAGRETFVRPGDVITVYERTF